MDNQVLIGGFAFNGYFVIFIAIVIGILVASFAKSLYENSLKSTQIKRDIAEYMNNLINETKQSQPWLAGCIADIQYLADVKVANELAYKKHPARSAAEEVKKIAAEKRDLKRQCKQYEYQLSFLEHSVPWLAEYERIPIMDAIRTQRDLDSSYDALKDWLSPEEYSNLSTVQKSDLALNRWLQKEKSPWEVGRDYERFIGYIHENDGFSVEYVGALQGKEDRGIDLIAKKKDTVCIIQCKRYSMIKSKYVHENTVAQLFGTSAVYSMENPNHHVIPVIFTSSELSPEAKHFAEYLKISVCDNVPLDTYPMVKCNITKSGEKIYHMPFDQQYDKIKIAGKKGAMYLHSAAEAEALGFRRAKKWVPDKSM